MGARVAIEAQGLTMRYGGETAVDGLSFEVPSGTVFGFLGPNGAGKSTTIEMLTAMRRPTSGTARVAGAPVTDREAVASRVGYLPESPPVYESLSAREQLSYIADLRDVPEPTARERIADLLDRFDLAADAHRPIGSYSKGMRQKVALIQAVVHEPSVLFLDEPTSGLDPRSTKVLREFVGEIAAGDATVFLSTHVLPVVDELADEVGVLYDGTLVAEGSPGDLKGRAREGDSTLEDAFLRVTGDVESELSNSVET